MEQRNMLLQIFFALATYHKTCREGPHSSIVQRSMVLVHTVLVVTKHAGNGNTSVWIIDVCFFRLKFGLVFLPQRLQGKASLLYGSMEYALSGWTQARINCADGVLRPKSFMWGQAWGIWENQQVLSFCESTSSCNEWNLPHRPCIDSQGEVLVCNVFKTIESLLY